MEKELALVLDWAFNESQNCQAQGIIAKHGTDDVWLSCTSYIAHGRLRFDSNSRPVAMVLDRFNLQALEGPQEKTGSDYRHISDGDYHEVRNELWFGIEGGSNPRVLRSAIVRYDADTLQFIDIHEHPTFTTMPWLVVDANHDRAITCNWTNSQNQLAVFDIKAMNWANDTITLLNVPSEYALDGIPYIQGGSMAADGMHFVLQSDDLFSTIYMVSFLEVADLWHAQLIDTWATGLGKEREGVALARQHVLSFGNRDNSWEHRKNAQIFVLPIRGPSKSDQKVPFGLGVLIGIAVSFIILLLMRFCGHRNARLGSRSAYTADVATLSQVDEDEDVDIRLS